MFEGKTCLLFGSFTTSCAGGFGRILMWCIRGTAALALPASRPECASLSALSCKTSNRDTRLCCDRNCHCRCIYANRCLGTSRTHLYCPGIIVDAHSLYRPLATPLYRPEVRAWPLWPGHEKYNVKEQTTRIEAAWDRASRWWSKRERGFGQTLTKSGFVMASACKNHQRAK